jgi:hypothetical protein
MTDHSGQPVEAFQVGPQREQRLIIGEGVDPDDLQATGAWVGARIEDTIDLEGHR